MLAAKGLLIFQLFCLQFGAKLDVPIHNVALGFAHPELRGWVASCPLGFNCPNEIFINTMYAYPDKAFLRYLAAHEVCHLKNGDQRVWALSSKKERERMHGRVHKCMKNLLGTRDYWMYTERYQG